MKFIDSSTNTYITAERIKVVVGVISIILVCATASIGVVALMESQSRAERARRADELESMLAATTVTEETSTTTTEEETSETLSVVIAAATEEPAEESSETIEETTVSSETTEATTTTTEATTTTTAGITESALYATVYAMDSMNVRTGPGTEYDLVKTLKPGDRIDVVATTSNGWYRTYNGNYVLASLTTSTPPATTTTTASTTRATTAATAAATTTSSGGGSTPSGMTYYGSCTITFYGPQPLGNGQYSTTTATGTTCTQGRTCAADWGIFPAGTTIYVANDPLGGDGYYTVEDRGGGVRGSHIDIYADAGESSAYSTTSRDVYIVN